MQEAWYVFYTKSRQEKKVDAQLRLRGFKSFLPLQVVMRQWSDRKKKVEVPLFNSYIFVFTTLDRIADVLHTPGIAWNIRHNGKPAVLHENELRLIKRFLESGLLVEANSDIEFAKGDRVEVVDGPLKGMRGTLLRTPAGEKFSVVLESIQQNITITLDPLVLAKY